MADVDVIVIGAGLAGLRCAERLAAQGADVVVLEARDRVGGRVRSHRFADGQAAELGADRFTVEDHAVRRLADDLDLAIVEVADGLDPAATLVDAAGRAVPMHLHARVHDDLGAWTDAVRRIDGEDPAAGQQTLADLLHGLGLSVISRVVIGRLVRSQFMLPPDEVSQRWASRAGTPGFVDRSFRVRGGNDLLAKGLATRLGGRLRLGAPVGAVDADSGTVHLSGGETMRGEAIVAAVPLPVLSRLGPRMPLELGALGYGVGGTAAVQFQRRLWRDYGRNGSVLSDRQWGHVWEATAAQHGDAGVLSVRLASHDGAALACMPEAVEAILRDVDRAVPGAAGLAGERVSADWSNDPYSLGTVVCAGPGQWDVAAPFLRRVFGHLRLAGEHASARPGSMDAALVSGEQVARELC